MSAAASLGDGVVLLGGYSMLPAAAPSASVWAYDSASDRWAARAPLPIPIGFPLAATVGGRIYVHDGGDNERPVPGDRWYLYDPALDRWSALPPSPGTFSRGAVVGCGDRLLALGGMSEHGVLERDVNALDGRAARWSVRAPLPHRLVLRATAAVDGLVVVAGGHGAEGAAASAVDVLDVEGGRWSAHEPLSLARASATLAVHERRLVVLGGWNAGGPVAETHDFPLMAEHTGTRLAI
jgi:N-acetylneuraminic acid mutarotase